MPKCLICGIQLVKPEDFSQGDLSKSLCAQCSRPRVSQWRAKPWQDTSLHKKFGDIKPPNERELHQVFKAKLRQEGKSEEEIEKLLEQWHNNRAA